jgi:hypothetical protein
MRDREAKLRDVAIVGGAEGARAPSNGDCGALTGLVRGWEEEDEGNSREEGRISVSESMTASEVGWRRDGSGWGCERGWDWKEPRRESPKNASSSSSSSSSPSPLPLLSLLEPLSLPLLLLPLLLLLEELESDAERESLLGLAPVVCV